MQQRWTVSDEAVAVVVRGPRGESLEGSIVRSRDDRLTLALGLCRTRHWRLGDRIAVALANGPADCSCDGRVYSFYRALRVDFVILDLEAPRAAPRPPRPPPRSASFRLRRDAPNRIRRRAG